MAISTKDQARFWARVDRGPSCWDWTGTLVGDYGQFSIGPKAQRKKFRVHRFSYILAHGSLEEEAIVRHTCDNPLCVNPSHLVVGSHAQNMEDMMTRGRQAVGERCGNAKLTEQQALDIRSRLMQGTSVGQLARDFLVSRRLIGFIRDGKVWKHLKDDSDD